MREKIAHKVIVVTGKNSKHLQENCVMEPGIWSLCSLTYAMIRIKIYCICIKYVTELQTCTSLWDSTFKSPKITTLCHFAQKKASWCRVLNSVCNKCKIHKWYFLKYDLYFLKWSSMSLSHKGLISLISFIYSYYVYNMWMCDILWHDAGKREICTILHNGSDETRTRHYVS